MARPKKEKVEKEESKQEPFIDALGNYVTSDSDNRGILEDETHIIGKEQVRRAHFLFLLYSVLP